MSAVPVFCRAAAKVPGNMTLRYVKTPTLRPLGPIRTIQDRSNMAKSISGTATVYPVIPTVELQHESEIPSAYVLSRLNIFDLCRDQTRLRECDCLLRSDQMRNAREALRQQVHGDSPKKSEGGTVTQFLVHEGRWEHGSGQEHSDQEEHGTVMGSEVRGGGGSENTGRRHDGDGERIRE
ncbi:hypothetical protein BDR22DRAFT_889146 [Usnea florida]